MRNLDFWILVLLQLFQFAYFFWVTNTLRERLIKEKAERENADKTNASSSGVNARIIDHVGDRSAENEKSLGVHSRLIEDARERIIKLEVQLERVAKEASDWVDPFELMEKDIRLIRDYLNVEYRREPERVYLAKRP